MRLIVVSNRVSVPSNDGVQAGGMTVGIRGTLDRCGGVWLGWSGRLAGDGHARRHHENRNGVDYITVDLPTNDFQGYYTGFANQVLWPLFHGRLDLVAFDPHAYGAYCRINAHFADELVRVIDVDDVIWVHDYHLIPLAYALRQRGVRNRIGFFLHTPFGDPADVMKLKVRDDLAQFLDAFDVLGFQTNDDLRAFRGFMAAQSWLNHRQPMRRAMPPLAATFPIGIDTSEFEAMARAELKDLRLRAAFEKLGSGASPIIAVDRLDYSKGIPERLCAFETFLTLHPEFAGRVGLIQVAPKSRDSVPAYRAEAKRVNRALSGLCATHEWGAFPPAQLLTDGVDRRSIAAAYRRSRVALVTPLRDGMNLVAKEYVAAQDPDDPGVLVLSPHAGAGAELSDGALMVDPHDPIAVAQALERALTMERGERQQRWAAMMRPIRRNDVGNWATTFLAALTSEDRRVREPVPAIVSDPQPVPAGARVSPALQPAIHPARSSRAYASDSKGSG